MKVYDITNEEVDTCESYFGTFIFNNNNLIIPYINLGIAENELNPDKNLMFINYCYVVAKQVNVFRLNENSNKIESQYFGGEGIGDIKDIYDIEVQAQQIQLYLLENYKLADIFHMWIPISENSNMNVGEVDDFINNRNLPDSLKRLVQ